MAKDPAYPMYAQDFDMDTAAWGIDEIGVYIRLLNYEWINGYIPNNLDRISKIARISPRKLQKIWEIISKKFSPNGTHTLQNKRMEEEREKRNKYIESQRKSGEKGAKKRWEKHSKPNSDPISKPNSENIALHSSSSSSSSSSRNIKQVIPYQEIILYFNQKTGKNFRYNTDDTKKFIKARWNQGFGLDAFKFVIDIKTQQWLGDPKCEGWLRPQTLFGTKFESYLNETAHPLYGKVSDKTIQSIEALNEWEQKENEKQG